jgi:hypothetical protein
MGVREILLEAGIFGLEVFVELAVRVHVPEIAGLLEIE